ncbi:hypothetical protein BJX99DRAFT_262032 [Aspergillus californicus]
MGSQKDSRKHRGIHMDSGLFGKVKNVFKLSERNNPKEATCEQGSVQADSTPHSLLGSETISDTRYQSSQVSLETTPTISFPPPPPPDLWQEALEKARQSPDWKDNQNSYDDAVQKSQELNESLLRNTNDAKDSSLANAIATHLDSLQEQNKEKQWAYRKIDGETVYFRDVVSRIVRWVGVFKDPGNSLAVLDPTKAASLVWGFLQFFVERAISYGETRDMALDQEPIANLISRHALIEKSYLNSTTTTPGALTEAHEAVKAKIIDLYATILLYQLAVYKFWQQGRITHGIQSLVPHKLQELSKEIQKKSAEVDSVLHLSDRQLLQDIFENAQLKEPIAEIGCQLQQVIDIVSNFEGSKYSDVLEWVSPIRHLDHHQMIKPMTGTGQWLLEHPNCMDWRQSQHSGLFWLRGKMGAGKTNLVSTLISNLIDSNQNGQEHVAFFYIDNANRPGEAKSAGFILNALLKQLTIQGGNGLMQPVVAKYDQLHNSSSLHQEDCIALITSIVKEHRQTNLVIDAIDELKNDDVRTELLESLKQVVDSSDSAVVKIFISSRDQVNIATIMDETWNSRREIVVGERNHQDIGRFITDRVQILEKSLSRPIPDQVRRDMESLLRERANGMFLWVHLSLEYLRKIKAKNPDTFVAKLQSAPPDTQRLYSDILSTMIKDQDSEGSNIIQRVLTFLIYALNEEIFQPHEFLSAINDNGGERDAELSTKDILDLCSPLVEQDSGTHQFRLIHFSVKEFLQARSEYNPEVAHARLAAQCLTYLQGQKYMKAYAGRIKGFRRWEDLITTFVITLQNLGSSILFWLRAEHGRESTFDKWVQSFRNPLSVERYRSLDQIIYGGYDSLIVGSRPTPFFLACQHDLREVIEALLGQGWNINQPTGNGSGLSFACRKGHLELASYLIDQGAEVVMHNGCEPDNLVSRHFMFHETVAPPLVASMKSGDPEILKLLLGQEGEKPMQALMESALRATNRAQLEVMINHFPGFEYSADVQIHMFEGGAKLTKMLLAKNNFLRITDETLKHLFTHVINSQNAKDIIQCLLPLNNDFVASESFTSALKFYDGLYSPDQADKDVLELIEYTLKLRKSDPAILISEETLRNAMDNKQHPVSFAKALLKLNPSLKISNDLIRWAVKDASESEIVIHLLLQHDPTPRGFSQSELKSMLVPSYNKTRLMALLVSSVPGLEIDQELFAMAVGDSDSVRGDLEFLLDRAPKVVLSTELLKFTGRGPPNWAISQLVVPFPPGKITDELFRASVENWRTLAAPEVKYASLTDPPWVEYVSLTLKELIKKAPSDLILSEETYKAAYAASSWVCQQVLQRWPSEHVISAGLRSVNSFGELIKAMPSIKISHTFILSICNDGKRSGHAKMVERILAFQPDTVVTEDLLLAAAQLISSTIYAVVLPIILLQHEPHAHLTDKVVERVMMAPSAFVVLKAILNTRPQFEFNPVSISMCNYPTRLISLMHFKEVWGDEESFSDAVKLDYEETLNEALKRSNSFKLDEREMLDMMRKCTPDSLGIVLLARPDAVVTESVVDQLVSNRTCNWECGYESESFTILLDRAGVSEAQRQPWKLRFPDIRDPDTRDPDASDSDASDSDASD